MLEELGTPGAGISYWKSDSEADPPAVPLTIVAQSGADSFTPAEVAGIQTAAATWAWMCDLTFAAGSGASGITVLPSTTDATTLNYSGGSGPEVGSGPLNTASAQLSTPGDGTASVGGSEFRNALQQLGHAIGLANPGAYDSGQSSADYLPGTVFQTDTGQYTIMSDNDAALSGANLTVGGTSYAASTPMLYDVYAAQRLYGSAHIDTVGSTTFGFNVSPGLPAAYDFATNAHPVLTIYSHTAKNTLDLSGFSSDSTVNLRSGAFSSFAGMTDNAAIAYATKVDNLIEGSGTNTVDANDDADSIVGGSGANTIFLGQGSDTVQSSGHDTIISGTGDVLANASGEALLFAGAGKVTVRVTAGGTEAVGGAGRMSVSVTGGDATVQAGAGGTTVSGGTGSVIAWGKAAGDQLFGGQAGSNLLLGGAGSETLAGAGAGNFLVAARIGGDLLAAGPGNATLTGAGSLGANTYFAGVGADLIAAGAGNDTVVGGSGADTIFAGNGHADIFEGSGPTLVIAGPGHDTVQAGAGRATVVAGTGADVFSFVSGHGGGAELISKFKPGVDLVSLQGFGTDAAAAALRTARIVGRDTTIELADHTRITFSGVTHLSASSFA